MALLQEFFDAILEPLWEIWGYAWPVTLFLVAGFLVTLAVGSPLLRSGSRWNRRHLLLLIPLALSLSIFTWGATMEAPFNSRTPAPTWPVHVVTALLLVQLLIGVWVVWTLKGYRWFAAFTVALELWLSLAWAFLASMAITGDWL